MVTYLLSAPQHIWIVAVIACMTVVLFLAVIAIALFRRYDIKAAGWYGSLGFSLEAHNQDGPKRGDTQQQL